MDEKQNCPSSCVTDQTNRSLASQILDRPQPPGLWDECHPVVMACLFLYLLVTTCKWSHNTIVLYKRYQVSRTVTYFGTSRLRMSIKMSTLVLIPRTLAWNTMVTVLLGSSHSVNTIFSLTSLSLWAVRLILTSCPAPKTRQHAMHNSPH